LWLLKCGLRAPEIVKIGNLSYTFAKKGYNPLKISTKFGLGRESQVRTHPRAKFYRFGFINVGLQREKSLKFVIFWYIFAPSPHNHANFHLRGFKNVALRLPKSPKIAIFGINLPLRKNPGGPYRNLNIGAQLETFLYATVP